ncbi:hypothetical protein GCHA_0284 [Paraglaciecola chathamensis S18K6]|uniref:Uncharacterized protein n=1 Tax=Paraglaciecola chathamensis S18K6 TaxID=1127672 RepID=A0AAV3UT81_9ALTE|nr:hypothetical protein GCHA_0284 [Paraglaciecola chathamensis S18K6]
MELSCTAKVAVARVNIYDALKYINTISLGVVMLKLNKFFNLYCWSNF